MIKILIYGAGAIGSCIGGWLSKLDLEVFLLARGPHAEAMLKDGLTLTSMKEKTQETLKMNVITDLLECPQVDIVFITVKNYDLIDAAQAISGVFPDDPLVIGCQNGLINQKILPDFFSRVIYGVIYFSAWPEAPGNIGFQTRGPISIGVSHDNEDIQKDLEYILQICQPAFDCEHVTTSDFQNAVRSKMLLNLSNSLLTLIGHHAREITDIRALRKVWFGMFTEAIDLLKAAGYKEYALGGKKSWPLFRLVPKLPGFIANPFLKGELNGIAMNSMGQDKIYHQKMKTELASLNNYFIRLADAQKRNIPAIRTVTEVCRKAFENTEMTFVTETELWNLVKEQKSK